MVLLFLVCCISVASKALEIVKVFEDDQSVDQWQSEGWKKKERVQEDKIMELSFALKQENLRELEELFWKVSDPDSPKYGNHLTTDQITDMIAPLPETIAKVEDWLKAYGVTNCRLVANRDYLNCQMTCKKAERLLKGTTFFYFEHHNHATRVIRSMNRYHIRQDVSDRLDLVVGIHRFPPVTNKKKMMKQSEVPSGEHQSGHNSHKVFNGETFLEKKSPGKSPSKGVGPRALRQRYNLTSEDVGSHPNNSQSSVQFLEEYISSDDLKKFMINFVGDDFAHKTEVDKVVGPNSNATNLEAALDTEYLMSLGANISTWLWSTPGRHENEEPFLQWLQDVASTKNAPLVHTVSYGDKENGLSLSYMKRVNIEFMKAGLRGMSIFFSSGDRGADCKDHKYRPQFPASSPYVTAVGGTSFDIQDTPSAEHAHTISGGGFSDVFPQPEYQQSAVRNYLNSQNAPPHDLFNRTGRAYPDVAALCLNFWTVIRGFLSPGGTGTSASTPTFAGIISMVNEHRLKANKPSMGFLNPFIYKNPSAFYDVTSGCNQGCGQNDRAFCAAEGFDPVTGFGTPNFPDLVKAAMAVVGE